MRGIFYLSQKKDGAEHFPDGQIRFFPYILNLSYFIFVSIQIVGVH